MNQRTYFANAFESTLSSSLGVGATTINVVDTSGAPAVPFYLTLEPANDDNREVVLVSGKTSTTFTIDSSASRGMDGTTDVAHASGAVVKVVPVAAALTDLHDRIDGIGTPYTPGGTDVPVADGGTGASTAAGARTNLGAQAQSAVLDATTASFTTAKDTKLTGIEAGADVTDAANVAAAGAVMESDTTTAAMAFVVDEDNMASNSATKVPTQQSVKAYVDAAGLHIEAKVTAGSSAIESVTWTTPFLATPVVVASAKESSDTCFVVVRSISTTGASVESVDDTGTSRALVKYVMAMGPT